MAYSSSSESANIAVVAVLPPTAGSRGNETYISLQFRWDSASNTIDLLDFRGGDWTQGDGKTLVLTELVSISPTIEIISPSSSEAGVIRGTARARLTTFETFSYLDRFGQPDIGIIKHEADVEFVFAAPLVRDDQ